jgi:hypothetical protein
MKKSKGLFNKYVNVYSNLKIKAEREGNDALRAVCKWMVNWVQPYII